MEKARKIFDWVILNIDYEIQTEEIGAFGTYNQGIGDCSDYSDLFITLLRIQFFNHIDFLRFNLNIGAWFFLPGASPPNNYVSEFPINPSPVCSNHSAYNCQYTVEITVLESNITPESAFPLMTVIFIAVGGLVPVLIIVILVKKGRKKYSID